MPSLLTKPPRPAKKPSLALLIGVTMTGTLAMHVFVPALADTARDLGTTPFAAQLTITLYLVGLAAGQLVYGPLSDRFGRRPLLVIGMVLYLVGLLVAWPAPSIGMLIAARVLQSLGACGALVLGRAMVRDVSDAESAARQIAILMMVMTLTPALAPAIGGYLNGWFGWRAIFGLLAVLVGCLTAIVVVTLPETNRQPVPLPGVGAVLVNYVRLMRTAKYRNFLIAGSFAGVSLYAFLAAAPFIIVDVLGHSAEEVGVDCLIVTAGMAIGSAIARALSRNIEIRRAARHGNWLSMASAVVLLVVQVSGHLTLPTLIGPLFVYAMGVGITGPNAVAGLMNVDLRRSGAASSLYGFCQMGCGALFTLAVALWHTNSALPVAVVLLFASFVAAAALSRV